MTSCGCFIWGTMTTGFAFCTSIAQGVAFWAINGIGEPASLLSAGLQPTAGSGLRVHRCNPGCTDRAEAG